MLLKGYMKIIYRSNIVARLLSCILFLSIVWADPPDWEDDIGGYQFVATLVGGVVLNEGVQMGDAGDLFAAFDENGNVRGIAVQLSPTFGPFSGTTVYEMTMRSNAVGDVLTFQYYDASEGAILVILKTYTFLSNDQWGDVVNPIIFNVGCVDDATGIYADIGGCAGAMAMGLNCDNQTYVAECPLTCNSCPADCEANGPTSHGCCLPDLKLFISSDGSVLYNTSEAIGGIQFDVDGDGVVINEVSGGAAEEANFGISFNSTTNRVIGFSLSGATISADCGTLVEVELEGIPTGLSDFIISDPVGNELDFGYFDCGGDGSSCLDIKRHLLPDEFGIVKIYPNPFNPVTQIQYDVSAYAFVKVQTFDIQGREVALLMNEYQSPGRYNITWHAGNHASGMYFVEMIIRHGDDLTIFRDMHKILYLK